MICCEGTVKTVPYGKWIYRCRREWIYPFLPVGRGEERFRNGSTAVIFADAFQILKGR
jgi:hypothetical protein